MWWIRRSQLSWWLMQNGPIWWNSDFKIFLIPKKLFHRFIKTAHSLKICKVSYKTDARIRVAPTKTVGKWWDVRARRVARAALKKGRTKALCKLISPPQRGPQRGAEESYTNGTSIRVMLRFLSLPPPVGSAGTFWAPNGALHSDAGHRHFCS